MATLRINNVNMPEPSSLTWDNMDIDSSKSGRNANGAMLRDRIASKVKLAIEWKLLSPADMSTVLTAISPAFFQCTYPDAKAGGFQSKTMYAGDRSAPALVMKDGVMFWSGLKVTFTEQ